MPKYDVVEGDVTATSSLRGAGLALIKEIVKTAPLKPFVLVAIPPDWANLRTDWLTRPASLLKATSSTRIWLGGTRDGLAALLMNCTLFAGALSSRRT